MVLPKPAVGLPLAVEVGAIPIVGHRWPNPGDEGEQELLGANRTERFVLFDTSDELGRRRGGSPGGRHRRCLSAAEAALRAATALGKRTGLIAGRSLEREAGQAEEHDQPSQHRERKRGAPLRPRQLKTKPSQRLLTPNDR